MLAPFIVELGVQRFESVVGRLAASMREMVLKITIPVAIWSKGGYMQARFTFGEACRQHEQ